jgi:hypothetical protein
MTTDALPIAIRRTQYAVFVVAAVHVAAIGLLLTHRDALHAGQLALHPDGDIGALTEAALLQSLIPHVVLAVLLPLRALRLADGRRRSRIFLTVLLSVQILAHATAPMVVRELPGYGGWIVAVQAVSLVFEAGALAYLWSPSARPFFARVPALAY